MTLPTIDKQQVFSALDDAVPRFVAQLRSVPDPTAPAIGVWNVAELATHVSHLFGLYPAIARGQGSPVTDHRTIAQEWQTRVRNDPERDLEVLAQRIERGIKEFKEVLDSVPWDDVVLWHGGVATPVGALGGVLLNECELHGNDIAKAAGRSWRIDPDHARLVFDAHLPWTPQFVDEAKARELGDAVVEIGVRGGTRAFFSFHDGTLDISTERPRDRVDCHVSADPVAYLLIGYGRSSPIVAALTGKVFAWGRRPLLSLRLADVFFGI